jgi:hypothetical protein
MLRPPPPLGWLASVAVYSAVAAAAQGSTIRGVTGVGTNGEELAERYRVVVAAVAGFATQGAGVPVAS